MYKVWCNLRKAASGERGLIHLASNWRTFFGGLSKTPGKKKYPVSFLHAPLLHHR